MLRMHLMVRSPTGKTLVDRLHFTSSFPMQEIVLPISGCSLVQNTAAVQFLHKDVYLTEPARPDVYFSIGDSNLDVLHCPHQVIHQSLAIIADNVDHTV